MTAKSLAVAKHMLERCRAIADPAVTPMQLIKLVYIAHGYMLGRHGIPLLDEMVEAWRYGPVVPSVYHAVKHYQSRPIQEIDGACDNTTLSPEEKQVIENVARIYGKHNGVVLSAATHKTDTPWQKTWRWAGQNAPISNDLIEAFYSEILKSSTHSSL